MVAQKLRVSVTLDAETARELRRVAAVAGVSSLARAAAIVLTRAVVGMGRDRRPLGSALAGGDEEGARRPLGSAMAGGDEAGADEEGDEVAELFAGLAPMSAECTEGGRP